MATSRWFLQTDHDCALIVCRLLSLYLFLPRVPFGSAYPGTRTTAGIASGFGCPVGGDDLVALNPETPRS